MRFKILPASPILAAFIFLTSLFSPVQSTPADGIAFLSALKTTDAYCKASYGQQSRAATYTQSEGSYPICQCYNANDDDEPTTGYTFCPQLACDDIYKAVNDPIGEQGAITYGRQPSQCTACVGSSCQALVYEDNIMYDTYCREYPQQEEDDPDVQKYGISHPVTINGGTANACRCGTVQYFTDLYANSGETRSYVDCDAVAPANSIPYCHFHLEGEPYQQDANGPATCQFICAAGFKTSTDGKSCVSTGQQTTTSTTTTTTITTAAPTSTGLTVSTAGRCGSSIQQTCSGSSFGTCCSQYGYCGTDYSHCGSGCRSAFGLCGVPISQTKDGFCGVKTRTTCEGTKFGACCSANGRCGNGNKFCGSGCYKKYGKCN